MPPYCGWPLAGLPLGRPGHQEKKIKSVYKASAKGQELRSSVPRRQEGRQKSTKKYRQHHSEEGKEQTEPKSLRGTKRGRHGAMWCCCGCAPVQSLWMGRAHNAPSFQIKTKNRLGWRREMTSSAETFHRLDCKGASVFLFWTINFFLPSFLCYGTMQTQTTHPSRTRTKKKIEKKKKK